MNRFLFGHPSFADSAINASLFSILEQTKLLSMATVDPHGAAHVNAAFFAYDDEVNLYIITDPKTRHAQNLEANRSFAVTVFDSHQEFWTPLKGVQLFGECSKTPTISLLKAIRAYTKRFPVFAELVKEPTDLVAKSLDVRFYTLAVHRVKVFDEPAFGEEVYIEGSVKK